MANNAPWNFTYNGIKYGEGTKVWFTDDFYRTHQVRSNSVYFKDISPSIFSWNRITDGKMSCQFSNVFIDDFVPDRDIKEIVFPVYYYTPLEQKINAGTVLSTLASNIFLYIVGIIVVIPFNGRLWAWIVMTYLFIASSLEKLSQ